MAVTVDRVAPVAHLPLVLGVLRKLEIATLIDSMIPPHQEQVVSAGRAVEALGLVNQLLSHVVESHDSSIWVADYRIRFSDFASFALWHYVRFHNSGE